MCGWKQKGFEMRFFALLLICVLAFFGCADGREKARAAESPSGTTRLNILNN